MAEAWVGALCCEVSTPSPLPISMESWSFSAGTRCELPAGLSSVPFPPFPSPYITRSMALISTYAALLPLAVLWGLSSFAGAKVFMVLMEGDAVLSSSSKSDEQVQAYKERIASVHDDLLESLLPVGSYTKLYSYTHLINGFAIHTSSNETLKLLTSRASGIRSIEEDERVQMFTTYTPEFIGIPNGAWPQLGGAKASGDGVVIGIIDTGINPSHPSFATPTKKGNGTSTSKVSEAFSNGRFKGVCEVGDGFPPTACAGKIVGARHFLRAASAEEDFNETRHFLSPFDEDGHGSHSASIAAGNHQTPVVIDGFSFGNASGMAPAARIAVYKAMTLYGGHLSDVVAAIDQAAEDGVDILSLSFGPLGVYRTAASYLSILETQLLFAVKAGVFVVQAVGNDGPAPSSIRSFSPWIMTVAASTTDRAYNNSIVLGNRLSLAGTGISPPTAGTALLPLAAAGDVASRNASLETAEDCLTRELFIRSLARRKIIICTWGFNDYDNVETQIRVVHEIAENIKAVGAAGFVLTTDADFGTYNYRGATLTLAVPGLVLSNLQSSQAVWDYYNANTVRKPRKGISFRARARILDGREAVFTSRGPAVASYSSRGPDVNNYNLEAADILKPNVMAPGSSVWGAWSPRFSGGDRYLRGNSFALLSGTSVATPHVAGVAALIKQKHPTWSPAAISSAMTTTANVTDPWGAPILSQSGANGGVGVLSPAGPFDYGGGFVNPAQALDPGLVFDADFKQYLQFLCAVPHVDEESVRREVGTGCPSGERLEWCSDLNLPSVTVGSLVGTRRVQRRVTSVGGDRETYQIIVREPRGVNVTVAPRVFTISPEGSRVVKITMEGLEATGEFTFGEVLMVGDRKHEVRLPLAVFVTSVLKN